MANKLRLDFKDLPKTIAGYKRLENFLFVENVMKAGNDLLLKEIGKKDLYFFCRYILGREDMEDQWVLDRCKEVQSSPDWHIDLWARGHFKSSVITIGLTIQDIINNPNLTYSIFSNTRGGAIVDFLDGLLGRGCAMAGIKPVYSGFPDIS